MENNEFFIVDVHSLDKEWVNQPLRYHEYAIKLADARAEYESAKSTRDVVDAELDKEIRANPNKYRLDKVTEGVVANTIIIQQGHQKADKAVRDAKHKVDILQAAVDTMEHRKKALEALVALHGRDYFSQPRLPEGNPGYNTMRKLEVANAFKGKKKVKDEHSD